MIHLLDLPIGTRMEVIAVGALEGEVVVTDDALAAGVPEPLPVVVRVFSPAPNLPGDTPTIRVSPALLAAATARMSSRVYAGDGV